MASRPDQTDPLFDLPGSSGEPGASSAPQEEGVEQLPLFDAPAGTRAQTARQPGSAPGRQAEMPLDVPTAADQTAAEQTGTEQTAAVPTGTVPSGASWHLGPRAAFDLETTGKDADQCRIVTAALLLIAADGTITRRWDWLADPGIEIPDGAAAIHGITTDHARAHGRPAAEVVTQLTAVIADLQAQGIPVLAFNASYDFTVLAAEARRHGLEAPGAFPVLDPYVMHKHVRVRWRGKRTLVALSEAYGVSLDEAHTSGADALAAEQVARCLAEEFDELHQSAPQIHEAQIRWAAEQAADFQAFLRDRRQDNSIVIDGTWPVRDLNG